MEEPSSGSQAAVPRVSRSRERVFRAPVWRQVREGSWPFVLSVFLPPLIVIGSLIYALITEDSRSLWGVMARWYSAPR